ncbi:DEAD DEAH box helicase family protein [Cryptosporidium andersoni]|uniref:RNA helicase n=1 Tax=Cryptosporidium andersoni TaxID=117008 RepID=A0A1J4MDJ3_9CRYT|nr:DEAD DEAH box helicase family protein [Cryptosporidium andersoni]
MNNKNVPLLAISQKIKEEEEIKKKTNPKHKLDTLRAEEQELIAAVQKSYNAPLVAVHELAKGIVYDERMRTSWRPPPKYAVLTPAECSNLRSQLLIDVNGVDIPPPIMSFKDMGFPKGLIDALSAKGIMKPTQIQMQGLPVILSGRDMIGIAFTGSGKTIVFTLPMVMYSLESELKLHFMGMEGPDGLILCPSRELALQTTSIIEHFVSFLSKSKVNRPGTLKRNREWEYSEKEKSNSNGNVEDYNRTYYPLLNVICLIGGESAREKQNIIQRQGVHMIVATPGRLADMLRKKKVTLYQCRYFCMDEADRLTEAGFEEAVRYIFDNFHGRRQTVLFSATMPQKTQEFTRTALVDPIVVNVGRAGAATLNVLQELEYVRQECRLPHILQSLQKTAPRVLIFCENKKDVDEIHEYLLLKGVKAAAIHSGLSQEQRRDSVEQFRLGLKDVLIGTDVASKGLDFPNIHHVINYDMPKEIENYVHRIGRTGRGDSVGVSTTFINNSLPETLLCDLKALLIEAKQIIPPFLEKFEATDNSLLEIGGIRGCAFCGGLGHRIGQCPKLLEAQRRTQTANSKDALTLGSRYSQSCRDDW